MIHPKYRDFYRVLGAKIAEVRRAKNWTQYDLGKKVGVGQSAIGHYEVGKVAVTLPMAIKIADALEVSMEELVG